MDLPPIIDIPVNIDAALRILQWSRQIYIGGLSMLDWAFSLLALTLVSKGLGYFIRGLRHAMNVPEPDGDDDLSGGE